MVNMHGFWYAMQIMATSLRLSNFYLSQAGKTNAEGRQLWGGYRIITRH